MNPKDAAKPVQIETRYGADAIPNLNGPGFVATYYAPGLVPGMIRDPETKRLRNFPTREEAIAAGAERLFQILNLPSERTVSRSGKVERYRKLTTTEFAVKIAQAGVTRKFLEWVYGTSERRMADWMRGVNDKGIEEQIPHPMNVLLELFIADPKNIDRADELTRSVTTPYKE
ncbi:hypothetical protein [Shinella zoogloeoides]|uniref:hypothetical protein n=1 Tax=Shinella zoogloeoides TaxID=352475 RepID=UPI00299DEF1C|nr:hypothetical protein [Shinella zoogloeoides]WPE19897.1 hypothetical protein ShzoTeo12_10730 [Shinella zoogloeoides]